MSHDVTTDTDSCGWQLIPVVHTYAKYLHDQPPAEILDTHLVGYLIGVAQRASIRKRIETKVSNIGSSLDL